MVYTNNTDRDITPTEHFDFGAEASDLSISKGKRRNIRGEVANKGFDPDSVIDAFERSKGIKRPSRNPTPTLTFKNIILNPDQQKDQDMLNELMNNDKYTIIQWKDTWTMQGSYRVFIIYGAKEDNKPEDTTANNEK